MKKFLFALSIVSLFLFWGMKETMAAPLLPDNQIEGIRIDKNLKDDPNVHLKELSLLSTRLYTIIDNDSNYYFCLNESLYYPSGSISYEFDSNQVQNGSVVWLLRNFYSNQTANNSEIESFRNENFETQYAATQIAIWYYTNPDRYTGSRTKIITNNPVIQALINVADTHKEDSSQPYKELMAELNKIAINLTDIVPTGEEDTYYTFQTTVEDENMTSSFYIAQESISVSILVKHPDKTEDITNQSIVSIDKESRTVNFKIPKTIVNENKADAALLFTANATVRSRNEFYLSYKPVGTSIYQPIGTRNTIEKDVVDLKSINIDEVTSFSVVKDWEDNGNQDGIRPAEVSVQLYGNNEAVGTPQNLNAANEWSFAWNNLPINDSQGQKITYTAAEIGTIPGYTGTTTIGNDQLVYLTNTHITDITEISGQKTWDDQDNQDGKRPEAITVYLLANGERLTSQETTAAENWSYQFKNLPKNEKGQPISYTIEEEPVAGYITSVSDFNLTNSYTPEKINVGVEKKWDDKNNQDGLRPAAIDVQLYANGEKQGSVINLNQANNWSYQWNDLDKMAAGNEIQYTVKEVNEVSGYVVSSTEESLNTIVLTNKHTPEVININGQKTWQDQNNQDRVRPAEITINLLANGEVIQTKQVTAETNWMYEFTDLPKYENEGQEIRYTLTENSVPGYSTQINEFDLINSYTPKKTTVNVTKAWKDTGNQDGLRPTEIIVQLYGNGQKVGAEQRLSEANQWTYTWQNLEKNSEGSPIQYTVKETKIPSGYEVTIDGKNQGNILITNTHIPETTKVVGQKSWVDGNNQDGLRPEQIEVHLLKNGQEYQSKIVTAQENWMYEFDQLPKYEFGQEIRYSITESNVLGYSTQIDGYNLSNTHTPGETTVTVTKAWDDQGNAERIRPETIQVQLYADNQAFGLPVKLDNESQWTYTWQQLPAFKEGKAIVYTVREISQITGYTTTINQQDQGNIIITNHHTPSKTAVPDGNDSEKLPNNGEIVDNLTPVLGLFIFATATVFLLKELRFTNKK